MFRHSLIRSLVVLALTYATAQPCLAADWITMFQYPAAWPARLRSLTFPSGNTLDASQSLRYGGAWNVSFGNSPPAVMRVALQGESCCGMLVIQKLRCVNAVTGTQECDIVLATGGRAVNVRNAVCMVQGPAFREAPPSSVPTIKIFCPTDLQVE